MGSAYLDTIEASWYSPIKLFTNPSGLRHRRSSYSARRRCNYGRWCRRGTIDWRRDQFRCKSDWLDLADRAADVIPVIPAGYDRSEEHTSELQSLMRISYAVFCLTNKIKSVQNR